MARQEYTVELYKKDLHDPDNHNGVITPLELDILESKEKWALEASLWAKLVEVMEFQLSYFKSWKMMLEKCCTQNASKVMFKILQAKLHSMWTVKFQMFKLDLEEAEEPEIKLPTPAGSQKKQENCRKTSTSASLTTLKPLIV